MWALSEGLGWGMAVRGSGGELTQDLRPGLNYVAPLGLVIREAL